MRAIALLFIAVAAASITPRAEFNNFVARFGKRYATAEERQARFDIFRDNMLEAARLNALNDGARYGVTKFSDLTREEFVLKYLNPSRNLVRTRPPQMPLKSNYTYPESWDWRPFGVVVTPGDQGNCGSCWAWSATSNAESIWALAKNPLVKLSEQQLIDCDTADGGCNGGFASKGLEYILKKGIMSNEDYPYKARKTTCQYDANRVAAKFSNWTRIAPTDDALAEYLSKTSPTTMAVYADNKWQSYVGGIIKSTVCSFNMFNHEVGVVGYGVDEAGKYWIVKNSWGPDWGEEGYIRLARDVGNNCNAIDCSTLIA